MANWLDNFFGFSSKQLKALTGILALSLLASVYLIIRDYSDRSGAERGLTIHIGDSDQRYAPLFMVDLNRTPADSFELIPGIGPVFASRIVAYRDSVGGFSSTEEITKVRGIGYKLYNQIKPYLQVSPGASQ
jgi:competence ComEA-like helix-hairpin-helix protein